MGVGNSLFSYFQPYGNPSITSEEDEITKKEREIIEVLEKEEEWRYGKALTAPENSAMGKKTLLLEGR